MEGRLIVCQKSSSEFSIQEKLPNTWVSRKSTYKSTSVIASQKFQTKLKSLARQRCLVPIILATQEAQDQRDRSLKSAQANSVQDPILKMLHTKTGCRAAQVVQCLPEECGFKPHFHQNKQTNLQ
jgi:hypothetical protein